MASLETSPNQQTQLEETLLKQNFFSRKISVKFELNKSDIVGFETPLPFYVKKKLFRKNFWQIFPLTSS